eukprot:808698-Pleurochrysis_carterae.AAC.1
MQQSSVQLDPRASRVRPKNAEPQPTKLARGASRALNWRKRSWPSVSPLFHSSRGTSTRP